MAKSSMLLGSFIFDSSLNIKRFLTPAFHLLLLSREKGIIM